MDKKRNIVKQSSKLVNAKYKLNTSEIKFILNVITKINIDDESFKEYQITVKELEHNLGVRLDYSNLKKLSKSLMSKPLIIEDDNKNFEVYNWFSRIKYVNKQGMFICRIDDGLKPYLLELKEKFVKYHIENIINLNSEYSIKIYQLLKQYESIGSRIFTVLELQDLLQVPDSYKIKYNDFKKKVLDVSQKELVYKSDIYFEYKEIKNVRKIVKIEFTIKENKHKFDKKGLRELQKEKYTDKYYGKIIVNENNRLYHIREVQKQDNKTFKVFCVSMDTARDKFFIFDTEKQLREVLKQSKKY